MRAWRESSISELEFPYAATRTANWALGARRKQHDILVVPRSGGRMRHELGGSESDPPKSSLEGRSVSGHTIGRPIRMAKCGSHMDSHSEVPKVFQQDLTNNNKGIQRQPCAALGDPSAGGRGSYPALSMIISSLMSSKFCKVSIMSIDRSTPFISKMGSANPL
jgi:hypothetical protein